MDDLYYLIFQENTNLKPDFKDVESTISALVTVGWRCSLYWLFKEEEGYENLEPPYDPKVVRLYKPHGILMGKVLNLCEKVHYLYAMKYGKEKAPISSLELFKLVLIEALRASQIPHESSKKRKLKSEREYLELLKNSSNPYCKKTEPQLFELVQITLDNLWARPKIQIAFQDFLQAMKTWIITRDSDHKGGQQWQSVHEQCKINPKKSGKSSAKRILSINTGKTSHTKVLASEYLIIPCKNINT